MREERRRKHYEVMLQPLTLPGLHSEPSSGQAGRRCPRYYQHNASLLPVSRGDEGRGAHHHASLYSHQPWMQISGRAFVSRQSVVCAT